MSEIVNDCPRCRAKHTTLDIRSDNIIGQIEWQNFYEAYCVCRNCKKGSILVLADESVDAARVIRESGDGLTGLSGGINEFVRFKTFISVKDSEPRPSPEYLPDDIKNIFNEGTKCLAVGCYNAAGTMFRLCLDMATRSLLPERDEDRLNSKVRRSLGLRLEWLFDNNRLPAELRDLSSAVKDDGNDGAHAGTLTEDDAEDLIEFAYLLLQRLYTEPEKLRLAKLRRKERRSE